MQTEKNNTGRLALILGSVVLLAGIFLLAYSGKRKSTRQDKTSSSITVPQPVADTAQPLFEIGYAMMDLDFYKANEKRFKNGDSGLLTYPVYYNEVTARLESDSPAVKTDYTKVHFANTTLREFEKYYKQKKFPLTATNVICLLVKQVGRADADSVMMDVDRVAIKEAEEIYDALDLGGNDFDSAGIRKPANKTEAVRFSLPTMQTGSSVLIPLCIANMYACRNCNLDPSAWQLASGIAYVPLQLRYRDKQGKEQTLSLSKNLSKPIYMEQ